MGFPRKFKALLETKLNDVESPDYLWLTYAVCAMSTDACGWGGWIVDGAFKKTDESIRQVLAISYSIPRAKRNAHNAGRICLGQKLLLDMSPRRIRHLCTDCPVLIMMFPR